MEAPIVGAVTDWNDDNRLAPAVADTLRPAHPPKNNGLALNAAKDGAGYAGGGGGFGASCVGGGGMDSADVKPAGDGKRVADDNRALWEGSVDSETPRGPGAIDDGESCVGKIPEPNFDWPSGFINGAL